MQSFVDFFYLTHRPDPENEGRDVQVPAREAQYLRENLERAEAARRRGDTGAVYAAYANVAKYYESRAGDAATGVYFYEKCLEVARLTGDHRGEMAAHHDLGLARMAAGEAEAAARHHERHLAMARALDDAREARLASRELAGVYTARAEALEAAGAPAVDARRAALARARRRRRRARGRRGPRLRPGPGRVRRAGGGRRDARAGRGAPPQARGRQGRGPRGRRAGGRVARPGRRHRGRRVPRALPRVRSRVERPRRGGAGVPRARRARGGGGRRRPGGRAPGEELRHFPEAARHGRRRRLHRGPRTGLPRRRARQRPARGLGGGGRRRRRGAARLEVRADPPVSS